MGLGNGVKSAHQERGDGKGFRYERDSLQDPVNPPTHTVTFSGFLDRRLCLFNFVGIDRPKEREFSFDFMLYFIFHFTL